MGCMPLAPTIQPDDGAIVAVVEALHAPQEPTIPVFLGGLGEGEEERIFDTARGRIASEFGVPVHSLGVIEFDEQTGGFPAWLDSVEGVTITLGRFHLQENGSLEVLASFVDETGEIRTCSQFSLERQESAWVVTDQIDQAVGCGGLETYDEARSRILVSECPRLAPNAGTCGPWLVITESNGLTGMNSYFDQQTGLLVSARHYTDVEEVPASEDDLEPCEVTFEEHLPCGMP